MSSALASSLSTREKIRQKVRRLTASQSPQRLSDSAIDDFINTFVLFDFPESVRLFNLRTEYEFYTDPNVDVYAFPRNLYYNIYEPIYIAGYESFYSQSREQFNCIYPQIEFIQRIATGDAVTNTFSGTLTNRPVFRGYQYLPDPTIFSQVFLSFTNAAGNSVVIRDNGAGTFLNEAGDSAPTYGTINYVTGVLTNISFPSVPPANAAITAQYISYEASRPQAMLFFNNALTLRPIPDQAYKVSMEVLKQPTALLDDGSNPALEEWWQYIAFGAAKKILEERQDMVTLANIMPMLNEQERLCLRRTSQQLSQERVATIFTEQTNFPYGNYTNRF